jgi:flagellar motor component MotA
VQNVCQTILRIVIHSLLSQTGHLGLFLQLQPAYATRFDGVTTLYGIIGPVAVIIAMITGGKSIVKTIVKGSIVSQTSGAPPLQRQSRKIAR